MTDAQYIELADHSRAMHNYVKQDDDVYSRAQMHVNSMALGGEVLRDVFLGRYWCTLVLPPDGKPALVLDACWYRGFVRRIS